MQVGEQNLPALQQGTGLDPADVEIDTLADRLRADAISGTRKLLEDLLYRVRTLELPPREPEREHPALTRAADRADRWEH